MAGRHLWLSRFSDNCTPVAPPPQPAPAAVGAPTSQLHALARALQHHALANDGCAAAPPPPPHAAPPPARPMRRRSPLRSGSLTFDAPSRRRPAFQQLSKFPRPSRPPLLTVQRGGEPWAGGEVSLHGKLSPGQLPHPAARQASGLKSPRGVLERGGPSGGLSGGAKRARLRDASSDDGGAGSGSGGAGGADDPEDDEALARRLHAELNCTPARGSRRGPACKVEARAARHPHHGDDPGLLPSC